MVSIAPAGRCRAQRNSESEGVENLQTRVLYFEVHFGGSLTPQEGVRSKTRDLETLVTCSLVHGIDHRQQRAGAHHRSRRA